MGALTFLSIYGSVCLHTHSLEPPSEPCCLTRCGHVYCSGCIRQVSSTTADPPVLPAQLTLNSPSLRSGSTLVQNVQHARPSQQCPKPSHFPPQHRSTSVRSPTAASCTHTRRPFVDHARQPNKQKPKLGLTSPSTALPRATPPRRASLPLPSTQLGPTLPLRRPPEALRQLGDHRVGIVVMKSKSKSKTPTTTARPLRRLRSSSPTSRP